MVLPSSLMRYANFSPGAMNRWRGPAPFSVGAVAGSLASMAKATTRPSVPSLTAYMLVCLGFQAMYEGFLPPSEVLDGVNPPVAGSNTKQVMVGAPPLM